VRDHSAFPTTGGMHQCPPLATPLTQQSSGGGPWISDIINLAGVDYVEIQSLVQY